MAYFASKRLNKLATKLWTIDNVLPNDYFSQQVNSRQEYFLNILFAPELKSNRLCKQSLDGDLFDSNCDFKNNTKPAQPFRQGRYDSMIYEMQKQRTMQQEKIRQNYLLQCYLWKQQLQPTTTPTPWLDATPNHTTEFPNYTDLHSFLNTKTTLTLTQTLNKKCLKDILKQAQT